MVDSVTVNQSTWTRDTVIQPDQLRTLLQAIRHQEPQALATLYDQYGQAVYSLAFAMTTHRETAEEITQDVFLKVWKSIEQYEPGTNFRAWMLRITRNTAIDRIRRDQIRVNHHAVWDVETLQSPNPFPTDDVRWVSQALHTLTNKQRQAVELAFLHGMTHDHIARILDEPVGTIKSRIRDGLLKLRDLYEQESPQ